MRRSACVTCFPYRWKGSESMMDILVGIVGVLLIAYLFVSVIKPEKF
ncbi:MAG: potassium-transporting ATPase subunit F [Deltaproteobacteria bacterium]|nr:potassium-transporting ATPase subunit F [Deltaproteobacteria bacterium]